MFCDVSGFTKLSEAMAKRGPEGAEFLIYYLNFYFSQVCVVLCHGLTTGFSKSTVSPNQRCVRFQSTVRR